MRKNAFLQAFGKMLVTGYAGYKLYQGYMFQFITICLVKGDEIVRPRDRHSKETDSQLGNMLQNI